MEIDMMLKITVIAYIGLGVIVMIKGGGLGDLTIIQKMCCLAAWPVFLVALLADYFEKLKNQ